MAKESKSSIMDKLIELIDAVARIDTKVKAVCEREFKEIEESKKIIKENQEKIEKIKDEVADMKLAYSKMKWIWGAVAFIVSPLITSIVLFILHFYFPALFSAAFIMKLLNTTKFL